MLTDDLFEDVLMTPAEQGGDDLLIVSGYATASMVERHFKALEERELTNVGINLIVGMVARDGMQLAQHEGFLRLMKRDAPRFQCAYVIDHPPVHAKIYSWMRDSAPMDAWTGSANYTYTGFSKRQSEALAEVCPARGSDYFHRISSRSVLCDHASIEQSVPLHTISPTTPQKRRVASAPPHEISTSFDTIKLPLIITHGRRTGEVHERAGLNWGQREGRNKDQAYIPVPKPVRDRDFFPPRPIPFAVSTHDGFSIMCVIAQDGGKAIHSTNDNAEIGRWFRKHLRVRLGERVERTDLDRYGRTDVTFYKIDEENYYMDFSV